MLLLTLVVRPATSRFATPSEATPFSYWSIKPWFITEGKSCCCAHHTFLLRFPIVQPNHHHFCTHQDSFLAPLPGRKTASASGVSHSQSFYFVIVFSFLFYFVSFI